MINQLISSFNAGELSPYLESRTNLDKYRNGCKTLENFLITPYGPANRRAGLEYRGEAKLSNSRCRLFGLNLTSTTRVILEVGVGYMRFWKDGSLIKNGANIVEAVAVNWQGNVITPAPDSTHPYLEADLRGITICQVNNVVYMTHPNYAPMRLSRYSDTNWTIGEVPWSWPPMLDQNITTTTITPSATTGSITLTASTPIFSANHVGAFWQIDQAVGNAFLNHSISANNTSSTFAILGKWQVQSFGSWNANIDLQASYDNGLSWAVRRTYVSRNGDYNVIATGEESELTLFRFVVTNWATTTSATPPRIQLSAVDAYAKGVVRITGVTGTPNAAGLYSTASGTVVKSLGGTITTSVWREGAFSRVQGYPQAISLHQSRLIFAGTESSPNSLWGSYSNDFQNYRQGPYDSDSWFFTLASTTGGRIQWIVSKSGLLVGTALDEWSLSASDAGAALTSTNVKAQLQSYYGSTSLPALVVNDTILYVQRMSRKIRELIYTWASESWISNDITALAEHTTRTLIKEVAYQRVPDAVLWFVRGDGQLVSMTYEREQQVVGFARHNTDGLFESVATINGIDAEDEVWVSVRRTINGVTKRYIERFRLGLREALDTGDKTAWFYVDSGVSTTPTFVGGVPTQTSTISGLSHLNGKSVAVWGGAWDSKNQKVTYGVVLPVIDPSTNLPSVVVSGSVTLQTPVACYTVGIPYTSLMVPERVDTQLQDGTSQGRKMRIPRMNVKVYQSFGGEYSSDGNTWFPMVARQFVDEMDDSPNLINGFTRMFVSSNWADGVDIYLRQTLPVPLTIAAIVPVWEASEANN